MAPDRAGERDGRTGGLGARVAVRRPPPLIDFDDAVTKLWERTRRDSERWMVEGAGHTEGLKKHPAGYEARVIGFFGRYLAAD